MRNILQLLGGVAVAGAVAAGATAFTASGLDVTGVAIFGGGTQQITVDGAVVTSASLVTDPLNRAHITGVKLAVEGESGEVLSDTDTEVTVALAGTATGSPVFTCGDGSSGIWTCTAATPASNYFTIVNTVDITVAPAA